MKLTNTQKEIMMMGIFACLSIIITAFIIPSAWALEIYSGESYSMELPESYDYYSIVGNETEIDLNITQEGLNVTITLGKYTQSTQFTLIFFNKEKEIITIIEEHYSGGGSSTIYKDKNNTIYKTITTPGETETVKETETITEEKVVNKIPLWVWVLIVGLSLVVLISLYYIFWETQVIEE